MTIFLESAENFHPYECNGPTRCRHCDRRKDDTHDPAACALCDPEYDGGDPYPAPAEDGESKREETEPSVSTS